MDVSGHVADLGLPFSASHLGCRISARTTIFRQVAKAAPVW